MSNEKIVSFIPIKLNNQRLPGKNLLELSGRPLCHYIFDTICSIDCINEKYVYCSDYSIQSYMAPYIAQGLHFLKRDSVLDGYEVKGLDIIEHFVRDVEADIYVLTHVTQPFTRKESIENALNKVLYDGYDSAFSCVCLQDYCWYKGKPLNYNIKDIVTTQNLEPVYMETGAFFIFRREVFTKMHQRIGRNPYMQRITELEAVDIDTAEDFEFARVVANYIKMGGNIR